MSQPSTLRGAARFRIEREIADTLQGRIYAGTDLLTNQPVVIKEAWRQLVHSGRSRKGHRVPENFLKERELVMSLTNLADCADGIVKGIDEWEDEHCYYYAMEYCEGELFDYISKTHTQTEYQQFVHSESTKPQVPMPKPNQWIQSVTKMFKQICLSVQWMHCKGYCHLDLSLENTMISNKEQLNVKLIDFGLTQHFEHNDFTFRGKVGKLQYMCPEAYARRDYNAKAADVWCLGVMLFMMLIGAPPYQAPQPQNAAFNYFVSGRIGDVLKHWKRLRLITVDALDLLNKLFKYEDRRIALEEVLQHSFFDCENIKGLNDMSLEKDDHKDEMMNIERNTYCDMVLQEWGLETISDRLHKHGWINPRDWGQLSLGNLKLEIGLTHEEAVLFIEKWQIHFGPQPQPQQQEHPPHHPSAQFVYKQYKSNRQNNNVCDAVYRQ
eukprot:228829_1